MNASMPPVGSFRCESCKLVQFENPTGTCRRCGAAAPGASVRRESSASVSPPPRVSAVAELDALPTLDGLDLPPPSTVRDLEGGLDLHTAHLELAFPIEPPARRASTVPPVQPSAAPPIPSPPTPSATEMSRAVALFLERDTGMVRTWVAMTLAAVCGLTIVGARLARMVAAEVAADVAAPMGPE